MAWVKSAMALIVIALARGRPRPRSRIREGVFRIEPDGLGVVGDGAIVIVLDGGRPNRGRNTRRRLSDRAGWPRCSRRWRDRNRPHPCGPKLASESGARHRPPGRLPATAKGFHFSPGEAAEAPPPRRRSSHFRRPEVERSYVLTPTTMPFISTSGPPLFPWEIGVVV